MVFGFGEQAPSYVQAADTVEERGPGILGTWTWMQRQRSALAERGKGEVNRPWAEGCLSRPLAEDPKVAGLAVAVEWRWKENRGHHASGSGQ